MADKTALRDMLNHMINGNEEAARAAFKEYLPLKTREIMGYAQAAEQEDDSETSVDVEAADLSDSSNPET